MSKDEILEKIKEEQVTMKPRWHFVMRGILAALLVGAIMVVALFHVSFALFAFHRPHPPLLGIFLPILVAVVCILLLEVLVQRYQFAYSRPLLYTVVVLIIIFLLTSFAVERTHFHERIYDHDHHHPVPIIGPWYHNL